MDEIERDKAQARLDAIEIGRLAGRLEAETRREIGDFADTRIRRAMAYAAWEFDGKPEGSAYAVEFGLDPSTATPSLEREPFKRGGVSKEEVENGKTVKRRLGGRRT